MTTRSRIISTSPDRRRQHLLLARDQRGRIKPIAEDAKVEALASWLAERWQLDPGKPFAGQRLDTRTLAELTAMAKFPTAEAWQEHTERRTERTTTAAERERERESLAAVVDQVRQRIRGGMSIEQVAKASGVFHVALRSLMTSTKPPAIGTLRKLAAWIEGPQTDGGHPSFDVDELELRSNPGASSIYRQITDTILEMMERDGLAPWVKPWRDAGGSPYPYNGATGRAYSGINIVLCSARAQKAGYAHNEWWSAKQVEAKGGRLRGRQKPHSIFFMRPMVIGEDGEIVEDPPADGELKDGERRTVMVVQHEVYNRDQCEDLPPPRFSAPALPDLPPDDRAESLIAGNKHLPTIRHVRGNRAFFRPADDVIQMPTGGQFKRVSAYYSTLFHECTHSTGHRSRLNRSTINQMGKFGDENYSKEELVAEMGAAFLCALAGIANEQEQLQSAAYLKSWRDRLTADPRLVVQAAAQASAAADYIVDGAPAWKQAMPERTVTKANPWRRSHADGSLEMIIERGGDGRMQPNPIAADLVGLGRLRGFGVIWRDGSRHEICTRGPRWLAWREDTADLVVVAAKRAAQASVTLKQFAAHERFHGQPPRGGVLAQMPDPGQCTKYLGLLEWVTYNAQPIASRKGGDDYRHFFGDTGERGHGPEIGPRPYYPTSYMPELWCSPDGEVLEIRRRKGNKYTVRDWIIA
jgi:antirestriction protein ArdC